ncbi:Notoamide biosynthesis transcriptional activator notL' [Exophiala dermatitidis]
MSRTPFRTVAPAISPEHGHNFISSSSSDPRQRKKESVACFACKRRRSKCDAGIPCISCISHNTECVKDQNDDGGRKLAVKRKIDVLEWDRHLLDELLTAIRTATPDQLDTLLSLIRDNATRQDLHSHIQAQLHDHHDSSTPDSDYRHKVRSTRRRMMGRIQDVVNPPISVPAKPWTTVTDDDDFVSHLMSLWCTWAHPWWHWVDEEIFLEAMRSGDTTSLICTPYLVNMILADACPLDTLAEDGSEPNEWIRKQFYNEAKRGLDAQNGHSSMAYVATLGVQWTYLNTNGQDQLGNAVLHEQIYRAKGLEKWRRNLQRNGDMSPQYLSKIDRSLDRLSWSLYTLHSLTLMSLERTELTKVPTRPKPPSDHHKKSHNGWMPYPQPHNPVTFHHNCHYLAFVSLIEEAARVEALFVKQARDNSSTIMAELENVCRQLGDWPNTLPECLKMHEKSMPHVIALHALHRWVVVMMAKQIAALEAGKLKEPSLVETPQKDKRSPWKEISIATCIEIGELLEQIRLNWGADHFPVIIMQPIATAVFPLLEGLNDRPDSQDALFKLCITVRAASRRFRVGKGVLLLLHQTAKQRNIVLPENCQQLLADFSARMDFQRTVNGISVIGMEYLLEKWEDLDLHEV